MNLYVSRQYVVVQFLGFCLNRFQYVLCLLSAEHENHALDRVVHFLVTELAEAWGMPDGYISHIAYADGHALVGAYHDVADVFGIPHQPDAANVIELSALRIEATASICVVGCQSGVDLRNREVIPVDSRGVKQYLVLHGGAAKA